LTSEDGRRRLRRAMDGGPPSVGEARRIARGFLSAAEPPVDGATAMDVLLAVSELVTNAVTHAPGPCTLELESSEAGVLVAVSDGHRAAPVPSAPRPPGHGGLGLHMLTALAGGLRTRLRPDGKTVSVLIAHR
jgi:anti-sigma regulatory factor (Ser/Thr protein kinase)